MMAISLPPLMATERANVRVIELIGSKMILPALRSQINLSSGMPRTFGKWRFSRGSMQVSATIGKSDAKGSRSIDTSPVVRWLASTIVSNKRISLGDYRPGRLFVHGVAQPRHLPHQVFELDTGETFQNRRQLRDNLCHIASEFAGASADAIATVDNNHLFGLGQRLADFAGDF